MTDLLSRPALRRNEDLALARPAHVAALQAAAWAGGVGLVLLGALVVAGWAAGGAPGRTSTALAAASQGWLVAHGSGLHVNGVSIDLVPWGLAAVPLLLLHRAGRWAAVAGRVTDLPAVLRGTLVGAAGYAAAAAALAAGLPEGQADVRPVRAAIAALLVAVLGLGSGLLRQTGLTRAFVRRLPAPLRPALHAGTLAAAGVVVGGAALATAAVLAHLGRIHQLLGGADTGSVGGLLVTLLGAALAPNAAVWGAAYAVGPGFSVGVGTSVATGGIRLGELPALPVLGALPTSVPAAVGTLALLVPVAAGVAAGVVLHRTPRPQLVGTGIDALGAGAVAGLLLAAAAALSAGSAGAGRLSLIGPVAWKVGLFGALEVAVAAGATALLLRWRDAV